jgi:hypothetical protein
MAGMSATAISAVADENRAGNDMARTVAACREKIDAAAAPVDSPVFFEADDNPVLERRREA